MMYCIETRIWLSSDLYYNEWYFLNDKRIKDPVKFTYHNVKTGKDTVKTGFTYGQAMALARRRRRDGRYKNYEFYITE